LSLIDAVHVFFFSRVSESVERFENNEDIVVYFMDAGWNVTRRQTGMHAGNSI